MKQTFASLMHILHRAIVKHNDVMMIVKQLNHAWDLPMSLPIRSRIIFSMHQQQLHRHHHHHLTIHRQAHYRQRRVNGTHPMIIVFVFRTYRSESIQFRHIVLSSGGKSMIMILSFGSAI
jgi:hypothetical protein